MSHRHHRHHHHHHHHREKRLLVRERLFTVTGKDFVVKESLFGGSVYTVEGDYVSVHDRRTLYNETGRSVYRMKSKVLSARGGMRVKDCRSGEVLATVRRGSMVPMAVRGGGVVRVWKGDTTDGRPWLEIDGEIDGDVFGITDTWRGTEAAVVHRKSMTIPALLFRKSAYVLNVRRGYDPALMIMLTIAIDDYYRE